MNTKRWIPLLVLVIGVVWGTVSCSPSLAESHPFSEATVGVYAPFPAAVSRPQILQIAHPLAIGSELHQYLSADFGPEIERQTRGAVRVEVYHGRYLSDTASIRAAVDRTTVEAGILSRSGGRLEAIIDARFLSELPALHREIVESELIQLRDMEFMNGNR